MSFDNRYRPSENKLIKDSPLTTLAQYTYMEDGVGNITQITDVLDANFNRAFGYDDLNRLTTANSGTSLWGTAGGNGYAYDAMGNITSLTLGSSRTATFSYSGTLPKLTSVTETGPGTRNVTYDATGNETQVGTGAFAYSSRNYLSSGDGLTYTHDGRGLRTIVVNSDATPAKRYFFYSPEMNLLSESALTTDAAPTVQYDYVWFNGHPVGQTDGGTQWTFTDHLGTPILQTDSLGDPFWRAEYEPYGRVFSLRTTPQHQPLRLPGQESEELNLSSDGNGASERFYNIFRWYRYGWGRYTQTDPLGLIAGTNLYTYVDGNPVTNFDRTGLLGRHRKPGCALQVFAEAYLLGRRPGVGWRYAHCWASCQITKRCGGPLLARLLGEGKEVADFILCAGGIRIGLPPNIGPCESAFQPSDLADNEFGRRCPPDTTCEDRCKELRGKTAPPGPFMNDRPTILPFSPL